MEDAGLDGALLLGREGRGPAHAAGGKEEENAQSKGDKSVHRMGLPSTVFDKIHYPPFCLEMQEEIGYSSVIFLLHIAEGQLPVRRTY